MKRHSNQMQSVIFCLVTSFVMVPLRCPPHGKEYENYPDSDDAIMWKLYSLRPGTLDCQTSVQEPWTVRHPSRHLRSAQIQKTAARRSPSHPSSSSDFAICQAGRLQQTSGAEGWDDSGLLKDWGEGQEGSPHEKCDDSVFFLRV